MNQMANNIWLIWKLVYILKTYRECNSMKPIKSHLFYLIVWNVNLQNLLILFCKIRKIMRSDTGKVYLEIFFFWSWVQIELVNSSQKRHSLILIDNSLSLSLVGDTSRGKYVKFKVWGLGKMIFYTMDIHMCPLP